jgi:hypothetical protein
VGAVTIMGSKKAVTVENLAALGSDRLVGILMALAKDDADIRRRLRLELAGQAGSEDIAAEIAKRLISIRNARSLVDWRKSRGFVKDLDLQRAMIVDRVASSRPDLALDLMWRFMSLADSVFNRVDDSNGTVGDVFRSACNDLATLASKAKPDPETLAERVFAAITDNGYGVFDDLVEIVFPALGETGVARLKSKLDAALADCPNKAARHDRRADSLRRALQDLASAEGNVDGYIALVPAEVRKQPAIAARIGRELLNAGRAAEALVALENGAPKKHGSYLNDDLYHPGYEGPWIEWEDTYLDALDATGQTERAQLIRWDAFEERLSVRRLRAYLKALPDFEDIAAEERAATHALGFKSFSSALYFFVEWPDLAHAAQLVLERRAEIDGNAYYLLDPAARLLEGKHPLAATLLRRAMIDDTLDGAKSTRYKHAARHLMECQSLASAIQDYGLFETHQAFVAHLRAKHGRKTGFWSQFAEIAGARS